MLSAKTNALRHVLMAAVIVAVGGLAIGSAATPAQAQYYSGYGNPYYSASPYHNAYEAHRAWWRWHQYWRWHHYNYR